MFIPYGIDFGTLFEMSFVGVITEGIFDGVIEFTSGFYLLAKSELLLKTLFKVKFRLP